MDDRDLTTLPAREAIPELLDRYGDTLYRLGIKVCGDEDEAADLLQDVFLTAFEKWETFEGGTGQPPARGEDDHRGPVGLGRRTPNPPSLHAVLLPALKPNPSVVPLKGRGTGQAFNPLATGSLEMSTTLMTDDTLSDEVTTEMDGQLDGFVGATRKPARTEGQEKHRAS